MRRRGREVSVITKGYQPCARNGNTPDNALKLGRGNRMADTLPETDIAMAPSHAADAHDSHGSADPSAAPLRADVRETFSTRAVAFCAVVGGVAIVAGTIAGLTIVNN